MVRRESIETIPLDPINVLIDRLENDFLLNGRYQRIVRPGVFEESEFPGEDKITHYEMLFGLKDIDFSSEEKALYGSNAHPGIIVLKHHVDDPAEKQGWYIRIQRVALHAIGERTLILPWGSLQYAEVNLQNGRLIGHDRDSLGLSAVDSRKLYNQFLNELGEKRGNLIWAYFCDRKYSAKWFLS